MFIRNFPNYEQYFKIETLTKCLEAFDVKDFSKFEYVPLGEGEDNYNKLKGYPVLCERTTWEFEEWRGEWMRKVRKPAR